MKELQRQVSTPPGREKQTEKPGAEVLAGVWESLHSPKEADTTLPQLGFVFLTLSFLHIFFQENGKYGLLHDSALFSSIGN